MADTGALAPGTTADDSSVGTKTWQNHTAIKVQDTAYAFAAQPYGAGVITHYLVATNFGFSVPSDATITGIQADIRKRSANAGNYITDYRVRIVKGGTIGSTDRSDASYWPSAFAYTTYGGASDLWGDTWSPSDINASTFGIALAATSNAASQNSYVEYLTITVYYTPAGSAIPVFLNQYRQRR